MSNKIKQGILEWVNRVSHRVSNGQWDLMWENIGSCLKNKSYIVFKKKKKQCSPTHFHLLGGILKSESKTKYNSANGFECELTSECSSSGEGSARKNV